MKNVFIIGSKGIPANYGGFETFVDKLVSNKKNEEISYHVSCLSDNKKEFSYNGARCFNVDVPNIGSAKAILYDIKALLSCVKYIKELKLQNCIIYILASRIGPFLAFYKRVLENNGIKVYLNPDGHEWKRSKWNKFIKLYWKYSESLMIKHSDLIICDSKGIEEYVKKEYVKFNPVTVFIAYGADNFLMRSAEGEKMLNEWYSKHNITDKGYYLIVGRFVPENNYELMIKEFIKSKTKRDLVIITNIEKNKFYEELLNKTEFNKDNRIKFVGTVYNKELLDLIRVGAYGYLHGHEVGGTNPSLLEALATTNVNILLDVTFNREVGERAALYFNKEENSLVDIIDQTQKLDQPQIEELGRKAKDRIDKEYSWAKITTAYEDLFLKR